MYLVEGKITEVKHKWFRKTDCGPVTTPVHHSSLLLDFKKKFQPTICCYTYFLCQIFLLETFWVGMAMSWRQIQMWTSLATIHQNSIVISSQFITQLWEWFKPLFNFWRIILYTEDGWKGICIKINESCISLLWDVIQIEVLSVWTWC